MTSRRRPPAHRSRQVTDEEETRERKVYKEEAADCDGETPRKTTKKLRRSDRTGAARLFSPASSSVPSRSQRDEATELSSSKKTPQRLSKCKQWTSAFNSPSNDAEQQQEIFWDPHSPAPYKLENGKKRQAASKCTVDISDIVNRIAPKGEKPTNFDAAYLGVWIGDDAIPCTPVVARARAKVNRSRILNTEEELMKLAKQLDRNLVEHKEGHDDVLIDSADKIVNLGTVENNDDDSFLKDIPEEDDVLLALQSVSQSSGVDALPQKISQKSVDQEAEAALNALFDSSTQKYSGRLSQGLSDVHASGLYELPADTNSSIGEDILNNKNQPLYEKNKKPNQCSFITEANAFQGENECSKQNIAKPKETLQISNLAKPVSSSQDDFEDDWGTDILDDDSFVMQITQNPGLIATPKNSMPPNKPCQSIVDPAGGKVGVKSSVTSATSNKISTFKFVPRKLNECDGKTTNLHSTDMANVKTAEGNARDWNIAKAFSSTEPRVPLKSQISSGAQMTKNSNLAYKTNPSGCKLSKTCSAANNCSWKSSSLPEGKDQPVKKGVQGVAQTHANTLKKDSVQLDDWDDPKFSDEVLDMFCESDSLWEEKEEDDDDLLYQVCDDVERLSQVTAEGNCTKENAVLPSSSGKMIAKSGVNTSIASRQNKNASHIAANSSSNKFNGSAMHSSKTTGNKLVSPATVSGNCSNSYQSNSFLRTNQTSVTFNRSNSVPSGLECKKPLHIESRSQNLIKPQTATSTATNSFAPSKYSFTKIKPTQVPYVHTKQTVTGNESGFKLQDFSESKNKRSTVMQSNVSLSHQPSLKRHLSESILHSSKEFDSEEQKKKCSMEEIERKKQEALARRKMKARTCSIDISPT